MERSFFGGQAAPRVYDLLPKRGHFTCPLPEQTQQRFGKQSVPNGIAKIRRLWYTDRSKARIGFPWRSDKLEFDGPSERVIANQRARWCGNLHRIPGPRTSYAVGALIERPAEKSLLSRFLSAKRFLLPDICYKIGTFPRALNERPYEVRRKAD